MTHTLKVICFISFVASLGAVFHFAIQKEFEVVSTFTSLAITLGFFAYLLDLNISFGKKDIDGLKPLTAVDSETFARYLRTTFFVAFIVCLLAAIGSGFLPTTSAFGYGFLSIIFATATVGANFYIQASENGDL